MSVTLLSDHPGFRREPQHLVPRRELEQVLGFGRSKIFRFIAEGMPVAETTSAGHRFNEVDCRRWLRENYAPGGDSVERGYAIARKGASHV